MNFKSNGISGSVLQYFTLQIKSDLEEKILEAKLMVSDLIYYLFSLGFTGRFSGGFAPFCIVGGISVIFYYKSAVILKFIWKKT